MQASVSPPLAYLRVLTIAGSDSGGCAGIQADLKTFQALGCFGMSAITAITVQNTVGVRAIHAVPLDILQGQIDAVLEDIGADAIKIGMLHAPEVAELVAAALDRHGARQVVFDPVMVAAGGDRLIADETVDVLVQRMFPRATLITPNLDEAALLLGRPLRSAEDLEPAARELVALGAPAVLLKGGHLAGETVVDVLATAQGEVRRYESPRIDTRNLHGAGCTLSSAVAARLAHGDRLHKAVEAARRYVWQALSAGAPVRTGGGRGPLNHAFDPQPVRAAARG